MIYSVIKYFLLDTLVERGKVFRAIHPFYHLLSLAESTSIYRGGKQRLRYELFRAITLLSLA